MKKQIISTCVTETAMGVSFINIDPEEVEQYRKAVIFVGEQAVYRCKSILFVRENVTFYFN